MQFSVYLLCSVFDESFYQGCQVNNFSKSLNYLYKLFLKSAFVSFKEFIVEKRRKNKKQFGFLPRSFPHNLKIAWLKK